MTERNKTRGLRGSQVREEMKNAETNLLVWADLLLWSPK